MNTTLKIFGCLLVVFLGTVNTGICSSPISIPSSAISDPPLQAKKIKTGRDAYYEVKGPVSGPNAPQLTKTSYPTEFGESRVVIWVMAQQHLYWSGFVVGALFLVTMLEVVGLMGWGSGPPQSYDRFATEIFRFVILALGMAAGLGGLLLISLLVLYPGLMMYFTTVFRPVFLIYGTLVIGFTLLTYGYYYSWDRMQGGLVKWLHVSSGLMVNVTGIILTMLGNAWSSFMLSPAGVTEHGAFLGNIWHALHPALWNSLNVHRVASHILLGACVVAVYGAYRAMTAKSFEERQHNDWLSCIAFFCGVVALMTMPFGGYWLMREIYAYRQQMGITLLGGLLAWLGVVLVMAMGLLFFAVNYYLWQRIDAAGGSSCYDRYAKYVYAILSLCMMVSITPHTIVMTPLEFQQLGGRQHGVLANYGVESAKSTAAWLMILVTLWSWVLWQRCRVPDQAFSQTRKDWCLVAAFIVGVANLLALGIYGYFIPANVRIGLQIPMLGTVLSLCVLVLIFRPRSSGTSHEAARWGALSSRGYATLIFLAFVVTWVMGLGGYRRSSVRLYWHITDVMRDQSPWAFTHSIGFATNIISLNALLFWLGIGLIFWLAQVKRKRYYSEVAVSRVEVSHNR